MSCLNLFTPHTHYSKEFLRTDDGELEWVMEYMAQLGPNVKDIVCVKLIPLGGMDFMRTISYTLTPIDKSVTCQTVTSVHNGAFLPNREYKVIFAPTQLDNNLALGIKIKLEATCQVPANSIRQLYNSSNSLADAEIQCGGRVVKAHRSILSSQSTTLQTYFSSESFVKGQTGVYSMQHMSPEILEDVIKWMYMHNITNASDKATQLLDAAEYFQIAGLKEFCVDLLVKKLSVNNCLELLNLSYKYTIKPLKRQATDLLFSNRKQALVGVRNLEAVCGSIPHDVRELLGLEQVL